MELPGVSCDKWFVRTTAKSSYSSYCLNANEINYQNSFFCLQGLRSLQTFCINIAFLGAVPILATSLCHHTQNDWTPIHQVTLFTAHWWLPRHSTLDQFANSMWSQPWLCTPPQHYKSSQWRAESGRRNKRTSCHYFVLLQNLYDDTPPITDTCAL